MRISRCVPGSARPEVALAGDDEAARARVVATRAELLPDKTPVRISATPGPPPPPPPQEQDPVSAWAVCWLCLRWD